MLYAPYYNTDYASAGLYELIRYIVSRVYIMPPNSNNWLIVIS